MPDNRDAAVEGVATAVQAFMATRTSWAGTAAKLLAALGDGATKNRPGSPRALAGRMRQAAAPLRRVGLDVEFRREAGTGTRIITIVTSERAGKFASQPSRPPPGVTACDSGLRLTPDGLEVVGLEPKAACTQCGVRDGAVYWIRDPYGVLRAEPLHEGCALDWFLGKQAWARRGRPPASRGKP
jgi:hypothetical protein